MSRLFSIPLFLMLILAVGCQYNPFAHRFMTREPTTAEAVGTYDLTEVYVDMVEAGLNEKIRKSDAKSSILLRADGTASLVNFPFFEEGTNTFDYRFKGFQSIEARWKITSVGSVSSGGDDLKTVYGIDFTLSDSRKLFDWPTFSGKDSVDGMIFTLYDGDQGQILGFKKRSAEPDGPANGSQPIRSETNRTSSAAGSRR
jgi:hypothetical protein